MTTDSRLLDLRRVAKSEGWETTWQNVTRRNPTRRLVCHRRYRDAWSPGNMRHRDQIQTVTVFIDSFADEVYAVSNFRQGAPMRSVAEVVDILATPTGA